MSKESTPLQNAMQLRVAECYLFELGCSHKETASNMGISLRTLGRWIDDNGWRERLKEHRKTGFKDLVSFLDSNVRFLASLRLTQKDKYLEILPLFESYKSERLKQLHSIAKVRPTEIKRLLNGNK